MDARDLIVGIIQLANLFTRRLAPMFERAGITPQQWTILTVMAASGPMTMAALARRLMVSKQNMTGMVSRLSEAGYMERNDHPSDLRSASIGLTRRGRTLVEKLRPAYDAWRVELLHEIGERDLATVERAIALLLEKLS